jgi:hypothetical protein
MMGFIDSHPSQKARRMGHRFDYVIINGYIATMTSKELKRWLEKRGATFTPGRGRTSTWNSMEGFLFSPCMGKTLDSSQTPSKSSLE